MGRGVEENTSYIANDSARDIEAEKAYCFEREPSQRGGQRGRTGVIIYGKGVRVGRDRGLEEGRKYKLQ